MAGGAIAAKQVVGGKGGVEIYEGPFQIDAVQTVQQIQANGVISLSCAASISQRGELRAEIEEREDGTVGGTMSLKWDAVQLSTTCPFSSGATDIRRGPDSLSREQRAGFQVSSQTTSADGGFGALSFSGSLTNDVIRGTLTMGPAGYKRKTVAAG